MDFDPSQIRYSQLLDLFFATPSCGVSWSRQYRHAIFYDSERQKEEAERAAAARHSRVAIEPLRRFYLAEDYHQKYYLRQSPLAATFLRLYPDPVDFLDSTAVARANAFEGGCATRDLLFDGLSADLRDELDPLVR